MEPDHANIEAAVAVIFSVVFGLHLTRSVAGWSMQFGPYNVPMWASWISLLIAGSLAYHFWGRVWR